MNDGSKNIVLTAIAIVGAIGWVLALSGFIPAAYPRRINDPTPATVLYGIENVGGGIHPCLVMIDSENTSAMNTYIENHESSDVVVELTLTAKNAQVSFDKAGEFKSTTIKTITVPEGVRDDGYSTTFYVQHSNPEYISLYLDGKTVSPTGVKTIYSMNDPPPPITLLKDNVSGNYC